MEQKVNINDLPLEIFIDILLKLDGISLGKCRRVCNKWRDYIDGSDHVWHKMCSNEFKYSSQIAKRKAGNYCRWYHIYKNLKLWLNITKYDKKVRVFFKFSFHDKSHMLDVDYGVLPLKEARGIVFYDINLNYLPITISDITCSKIANNDNVTVILMKSDLYIQKCVDSGNTTEELFKADNFVLSGKELYYYKNRDVYKCDLAGPNITSNLIIHCNYSIKEIQYCDQILHIFTTCGKILNITKDNQVSEKLINCPREWVRHLRNVYAINDRNFVCYSQHIFKLDTDMYHHLYLEFPPITALFFYGDTVLLGTRAGELLLYRLSSQKTGPMSRPIFETLAIFPEGKFAVQLDVCEKKNGPLIIASTFLEIILVEYNFFPHEDQPKRNCSDNKINMYKRLLRLEDRLHAI